MAANKFCSCDRTNELVNALRRMGWRLKQGRHIRLYSPDGIHILTVQRSPSDHRAFMNLKKEIRHCGVDPNTLLAR